MANLIQPPFPVFTDVDGEPLENGYVYVGVVNQNPLVFPLTAYWDAALTIPAANIRTKGGYPVHNGSPSRLYTSTNYSILVKNKNGSLVYSNPDSSDQFNAPSGEVVHRVNTIADLRQLDPGVSDYPVQVMGYYTADDGGGGPLRYWDATSQLADNGGSVIAVTGVTLGRWVFDKRSEWDIRWFGCKNTLVDASFDNSTILNALGTIVDSGQAIMIPPGAFRIESPIVWSGKTGLYLRCLGQISTYECSGWKFNNCQDLHIDNIAIIELNPTISAGTDYGLMITDSLTCVVSIERIQGYRYGLYLYGNTGGVAYSSFRLQRLLNNYYGLYLHSGVAADAYVTECSFYDGRIDLANDVYNTVTGDYAVYMKQDGANGINNVRFYNTSIEGYHSGMHLVGAEFLLMHPRFELYNASDKYVDGVAARSVLQFGYVSTPISYTNVQLSSSGTQNIIIGIGTAGKTTMILPAMGGSLGFANEDGLSVLRYFDYQVNEDTMTMIGPGGTNRLNKGYESAGLPTTGTFGYGAFIWNLSYTGEFTKTFGWLCLSSGTLGTLSGVTATTVNGSRSVTLNTITGVYPGCRITINGVYFVVDAVNSATKVISVTVAPAFAGSYAVSYTAPVLKAVIGTVTLQTGSSAAIGYLGYADVASGATFALPAEPGSYWDWEVTTYNQTMTQDGTAYICKANVSGGTVLTASGNLRLRYFRRI